MTRKLTETELRQCAEVLTAEPLAGGWPELEKFARAIIAADRALRVPMPGDEIFRIARRLAPKYVDGMTYVPEWVIELVRAAEAFHGIGEKV